MVSVSVEQFQQRLVASGLMSASAVARLLDELAAEAGDDTEQFAAALVRLGRLTAYQARALLENRGDQLTLGNYVLLEEIGHGGMGQVFKAEHRRMERLVALKIMRADALRSADALQRFQQEVKAAAKLNHPNVVTAYDADEAGGVHFLVMEYVSGNNLAAVVRQDGPLPVELAVDCILQAGLGLQFAHKHGVVHRDVKPSNLLLDDEGLVRILDLGLARIQAAVDEPAAELAEDDGLDPPDGLTTTGMAMGSVDFMAPEQAANAKRADHRADVYSLGCTLYYLLTGHAPYGGESAMERLLAHRESPIPSLEVERDDAPAELDAVFAKMVAKNADERFQSMDEVLAALAPFADEAMAGRITSAAVILPTAGHDHDPDWAEAETALWSQTGGAAEDAAAARPAAQATGRSQRPRWVWFAALTLLAAAVFLVWFYFLRPPSDPAPSKNPRPLLEMADLIEQVDKSVVRINVSGEDGSGFGSGVVVDERGWIVTNFHVIDGVKTARALFRDKTLVEVTGFLAIAPRRDLALIKIKPPRKLVAIPLAADLPRKGEEVAAFGAPEGFSFSASQGIVGSVRDGREIRSTLLATLGAVSRNLRRSDPDAFWVQTTAPISRGNSGGPLVNRRGELVGINTWVHGAGQNLNFAASAESVAELVELAAEVQPLAQLPEAVRRLLQPKLEMPSLAKGGAGQVHEFREHQGPVMDVAVSPDGRYVASASKDKSVLLFDVKQRKVVLRVAPGDAEFHCAAFDNDGMSLVTGSGPGVPEDRNLRFWDSVNGNIQLRAVGRKAGIRSVRLSPDGSHLITTHDAGQADLRRAKTIGDVTALLAHDESSPCYSAAFSPNGQLLVTGGGDGAMYLYVLRPKFSSGSDMKTGAAIRAVTFSPDGRHIVSAGDDKLIHYWANWQAPKQWRDEKQCKGHDGPVTCLAFSPDGRRLASGGIDGGLRIWNTADGNTELELDGHTGEVTSVKFLPSGRFAVSSSLDGTVRYWHLPMGGER